MPSDEVPFCGKQNMRVRPRSLFSSFYESLLSYMCLCLFMLPGGGNQEEILVLLSKILFLIFYVMANYCAMLRDFVFFFSVLLVGLQTQSVTANVRCH